MPLPELRKKTPQKPGEFQEVTPLPQGKFARMRAFLKPLLAKVLARLPLKRTQKDVHEPDPYADAEKVPYEADVRPEQVKVFQAFCTHPLFKNPQLVAYIGSGADVSPIRGFPESHIDFVEPHDFMGYSAEVMREHHPDQRLSFVLADAKDYAPQAKQDVLIDVSSGVTKYALGALKKGGHLIHAATYSPWTAKDARLKLVGVILREHPETIITNVTEPVDYTALVDDFDARAKGRTPETGFAWSPGRKNPASWYIFEKVSE